MYKERSIIYTIEMTLLSHFMAGDRHNFTGANKGTVHLFAFSRKSKQMNRPLVCLQIFKFYSTLALLIIQKRCDIFMSTTNISGSATPAASSVNSKQQVSNKNDGGRKSVDDVLATLRELMPSWTISTSTAEWGEGFRNIQIDRDILQRMADDPKEFEKYKSMILGFEDMVEDLEKWEQENPGQSIVFEISLDNKGGVTSMSIVKTLMGIETRTEFELPRDVSSWVDIIRQKVDALLQGQVEDTTGAKSWVT